MNYNFFLLLTGWLLNIFRNGVNVFQNDLKPTWIQIVHVEELGTCVLNTIIRHWPVTYSLCCHLYALSSYQSSSDLGCPGFNIPTCAGQQALQHGNRRVQHQRARAQTAQNGGGRCRSGPPACYCCNEPRGQRMNEWVNEWADDGSLKHISRYRQTYWGKRVWFSLKRELKSFVNARRG